MENKRTSSAKAMALGGILAALAVVIMSLGTLIPVATYVCPMLCTLTLQLYMTICGRRNAWAWFGAVALLSLLFAPDKEAAVVFCFVGCYPILKPKFDRLKGKTLWKALYFNVVILIAYWILIRLMGLGDIAAEFAELGTLMTVVMLLMGNVIFFLLDRLLGRGIRRR